MQDWLVGIVGEDIAPIASIVLAALFVIVLALIVIGLLRRVMSGGMGIGGSQGPRVAVVDVTAVDQKRKLVLVRRDQIEHLILIGGQNDLLIESQIGRAPPPGRWAEPAPGQPVARPQHPGEQRRQPVPQSAVARREPMPPQAPAPRAPNVHPAAEPEVAARVPMPEARREAPAAGPVFVAPPIDAPARQDRIAEPPRGETPTAPPVEPQRPPEATAEVAAVAPDPRGERPVSADASGPQRAPAVEPARMPASSAPRPMPSQSAAAPVPRPQTAVPSAPRPMATPVAPLKRATPVLANATDTVRATDNSDNQANEDTAVSPPVAVRSEASRVTNFGDRRVDPPLVAAPAGERQPLSVRSFASTIQERPSSPPQPVAASVRQPASAPPVSADAGMSSFREDELAEMLSAEFGDGDKEPPTAPTPSLAPVDMAHRAEPAGDAEQDPSRRDLSLEEEMERLLRDFSLQTADRR